MVHIVLVKVHYASLPCLRTYAPFQDAPPERLFRHSTRYND